jgi:hypothetical protein
LSAPSTHGHGTSFSCLLLSETSERSDESKTSSNSLSFVLLTFFCVSFLSVVISVFAIVILSTLAGVYRSGHEEFVGGNGDPKPEDGKAISGTIFTAVIVYAVRPTQYC